MPSLVFGEQFTGVVADVACYVFVLLIVCALAASRGGR